MEGHPLFKGRQAVIATMHRKEEVIAPLIAQLGIEVIVPTDFNTDVFGTFTRDIKRAGNQLEAARKKAHAALKNTNATIAIASEGSFGPHPGIPFIQSNLELVLLVDTKNNLEIRGHHRATSTNVQGRKVKNTEEALVFAKHIGFPDHGVIVRRDEHDHTNIFKDIETEKDLIHAVDALLSRWFTKEIFIETDMRAHKNPTRMKAISLATEDLLKNIVLSCPHCHRPGFVAVDYEPGLRCALCGLPTEVPLVDIHECSHCGKTEKRRVTKYGEHADPGRCQYCNP